MRTINLTKARAMSAIGCMLLFVVTVFHPLTARATMQGSDDKTPFGIFSNVWAAQGFDTQNLSVLTPVTDEALGKVSAQLQKELKVKNAVDFGSDNTVGSLLTTLLKAKYGKKTNAKNDFLAIQYSTSASDFAEYLKKYPDSKFAQEADAKIRCLSCYDKWSDTEKKGTREAYEKYCEEVGRLGGFSYAGYDPLVSDMQQKSSSISKWYKLTDEVKDKDCSKFKDFAQYIDDCGEKAVFAEAARDSMELNKDRYDWAEANKQKTLEAYKNYLENHEDGLYHYSAQELVKELELWEKAKTSGKYDDYCTYYTEYPDGKHADEAIEKIKAEEEDLWKMTQSLGSIENYELFVAKYPSGYYASEAQKKMAELRLAPYLKDKPSFDKFPRVGDYSHPGYSLICLGNCDNSKAITVSLTGPTGYSKTIPRGKYEWVRVKNGSYKVLVQASSVENWWGNVTFENSLYANAWNTIEQMNGFTIKSNKDKAAYDRIVKAVEEKASDEYLKTLMYIFGSSGE